MCQDHAWAHEWPAGSGNNYNLNIPSSGIYTITFDASTGTINATADKTADAVIIPTIKIHSNITNSEWETSAAFVVDAGEATASLTIENVAAGTYNFGMRIGSDDNWTANGTAFTRDANTAEVVGGEDNCTFKADVAGDYTFTWTYATNTLTITYPEATFETYHLYVRNLTDWETFDVYAWGGVDDYLGAWPGKTDADNTATVDGATYNVYDYVAAEGSTIEMNLIFHNNVGEGLEGDYRQTLKLTEARDYYITVSGFAAWEGLSGVKRFRPYIPMEHVYGYQYDTNGPVGTEWPGAELYPDAEGWYEFIVNKGRTVVFNDGTKQTGDLAYTDSDPVADECAVWQGETSTWEDKTYMTASDDCNAAIALKYERTVTNGNYGTICLPYSAVKVEGAELFSIAGKDAEDGTGIYLDEASELQMGVPYIFLANADQLTVYYWGGQDFTPSDDHLYTVNGLVGFINEGQEYTVTPSAHNFILYNNGLYYVNSEAKIRSERAYIDWSEVPYAAPSPAPR
ncbi:MAG: starch-binding protein [Paludibacteraceae bacterium]|nr:starch-binding protein [Paludibacteraceae bacterium]